MAIGRGPRPLPATGMLSGPLPRREFKLNLKFKLLVHCECKLELRLGVHWHWPGNLNFGGSKFKGAERPHWPLP